jgi:DNA-binding NarL/FixJ family response regulator
MRILFLENHRIFAATVQREFLAKHSVTIVSQISAARQALQNAIFDIFLVDYDLDDGKGDEFVRDLRNSGCATIVIGVSSHDAGNAALTAAGATAICSKMQFDKIETVINRASSTQL